MYNDLLTIGSVTIHGYGLMMAVGMLFAVLVAAWRAKKRNMNRDMLFNIAFIALVSGLAGAKLLYCLISFKALLADPSLRIGDISEMVGFVDPPHFCKIFKKLEGISANEFRNSRIMTVRKRVVAE